MLDKPTSTSTPSSWKAGVKTFGSPVNDPLRNTLSPIMLDDETYSFNQTSVTDLEESGKYQSQRDLTRTEKEDIFSIKEESDIDESAPSSSPNNYLKYLQSSSTPH
jgi:hypothetical protein